MIRIILSGLWVCVATLVSSYVAVSWQARSAPGSAEHGPASSKIENIKTRMISVPFIADGGVQGYVIAQFSFNTNVDALKALPFKPEDVFLDEVFKTIYAADTLDFRKLKKQDLPALSKKIADNINKRFGSKLVDEALIQELNYMTKEEARAAAGRK
ncbi:MAG TPA: hypothetical protein VG900_10990 [Hyphomicrobiaceae bacterium]|jgi:hypothetical protein|nr:hypothetical protein [Hyphomicrobiaceae bacterium]